MTLMLDSKSGKKWQWIASQNRWLRLVKSPKKQFIASFNALNPQDVTFEAVTYRKEKFYIFGKQVEMWVPDSLPADKTEEYIYKQILNRNFLKALNLS